MYLWGMKLLIGSHLEAFYRECCVSLMITILGEWFRRARAKAFQMALLSKLADATMTEWPFEPRLDSICGTQRMFLICPRASRLCDFFVYSHVCILSPI